MKEAKAKIIKVENGVRKTLYFSTYGDAIKFSEALKPFPGITLTTYIRDNGKWLPELEF